ncbi:hypothetical protein D3C77_412040 [compost metagenome]
MAFSVLPNEFDPVFLCLNLHLQEGKVLLVVLGVPGFDAHCSGAPATPLVGLQPLTNHLRLLLQGLSPADT